MRKGEGLAVFDVGVCGERSAKLISIRVNAKWMRTTRLNNCCQHLVVFSPHDLPPSVHTDCRLLPSHFNDNAPLVESDSESIFPPLIRNTPCPLEPVAQCLFQTVGVCVPYLDAAVFRAGNDNGQFWVEARKRDV